MLEFSFYRWNFVLKNIILLHIKFSIQLKIELNELYCAKCTTGVISEIAFVKWKATRNFKRNQNMTHWLLIHDESFLLFSRIFASNSGKRIKSTKPILFKKRDKITKSLKMKNWSSNCKSWRHHRNTDYVIIITS